MHKGQTRYFEHRSIRSFQSLQSHIVVTSFRSNPLFRPNLRYFSTETQEHLPRLHEIERTVMRAMHLSSTATLRAGGLGIFVLVIAIYTFRDNIINYFSTQTASVASRSLDDQKLQIKAEALAKAVVHHVLNDPSVLDQATSFVQNLSQSPQVKDSLAHLLKQVVETQGITSFFFARKWQSYIRNNPYFIQSCSSIMLFFF